MSAERKGPLEEDRILALVLGDEDDVAAAGALASDHEARARATEYALLSRLLSAQRAEEAVRFDRFATPFGTMYVAATDLGLARVSWQQASDAAFIRDIERRWPDRPAVRDPESLAEARSQMEAYFRGELDRFDLAVDLTDVPTFQRSVLEAVRRVPFGQVVPYSELARRIDRPRASRAVGNALGKNPVAIVVPCHRVVRRDGELGGYGGGIRYKERLLSLEGRDDLLRAG